MRRVFSNPSNSACVAEFRPGMCWTRVACVLQQPIDPSAVASAQRSHNFDGISLVIRPSMHYGMSQGRQQKKQQAADPTPSTMEGGSHDPVQHSNSMPSHLLTTRPCHCVT